MRIDRDLKLDFSDVLIRPKRSTIESRKDVSLFRSYVFRNSGQPYLGVPIIASNMHGVGTVDMALALSQHSVTTALCKDLNPSLGEETLLPELNVVLSTGISDSDKSSVDRALTNNPNINMICIDVANGYSEKFLDFVSRFRDRWPNITIIAGNVVTPDITEELILRGADIVKVGIGNGCFVPGQKVRTSDGLKNIEDIDRGEKVLTHTGTYKTVIKTFKFDDKKTVIKVNDIKATPNHEFYVLHKKYKEIVTNENIHQYAEWVVAAELSKDYLLLKHK